MNKDELFVSEDHLEDLARTLPTPFYLYDEAGIRQAARRYRAAFRWNAGYRQFPGQGHAHGSHSPAAA